MVTVAHTVCVGTFGVARDSDERCFDSGVCRHSVLSYAIQVAGLVFTGVICRWPSRLTVECLREVPNTAEYVIPAVHYLIMSLPLVYMLYNPPVRQFVLWLISQSDSPSGVLLKMEVGIRKGAWQRDWRYPAYLWSLRWVYAVKKPRRLVYAVYPRIPPIHHWTHHEQHRRGRRTCR